MLQLDQTHTPLGPLPFWKDLFPLIGIFGLFLIPLRLYFSDFEGKKTTLFVLYLSHTNHATAHETLVDDNAYQSDIGRHFVGSVTILWWTIMSKKKKKPQEKEKEDWH